MCVATTIIHFLFAGKDPEAWCRTYFSFLTTLLTQRYTRSSLLPLHHAARPVPYPFHHAARLVPYPFTRQPPICHHHKSTALVLVLTVHLSTRFQVNKAKSHLFSQSGSSDGYVFTPDCELLLCSVLTCLPVACSSSHCTPENKEKPAWQV